MSEEEQKPTVLLVAGSAHNIRLVSKQLDEYFTVLTADDAEAAWDSVLEHSEIVLLICELDLTIDQFGLLERVRSAGDSWLAATPVLLLVGENDTDASRELAFQMGATDFINLPFASTELAARARLHANLYLQHSMEAPEEVQQDSAANLLQQLSQKNFFNSRAQQELSFSQRHRTNFSLCKLRLDNVKAIVASFDKATAIKAIQGVARIIQKTLRREDTLCYLGNAEFCLLYPATNGIGGTAAINRIFKSLSSTEMRLSGKRVKLTLSGAVFSCIPSESIDLEQVYEQLDVSLKQAQSAGGNQVVSTHASNEEHSLSIDRALKLIEASNTEELSVHAAPMLLTVLPLLEFVDGVLQLGLKSVNQKLRAKLISQSKPDPR